jgi:hypothetical protein
MRMHRALLLAAVFALSTLDGVAEEKQIVDAKELVGSWRGWVAEVAGDEWATMNVSADGSYKASTISVTTVGKFYLQAGRIRTGQVERLPGFGALVSAGCSRARRAPGGSARRGARCNERRKLSFIVSYVGGTRRAMINRFRRTAPTFNAFLYEEEQPAAIALS